MKKVIAALVGTAMIGGAFTVASIAEPASAQVYAVSVTCEAASPQAVGIWTHRNGQYACQRALQECAVRTPYGYNCYVTRWWYNY